MTPAQARDRFRCVPVARLATVTADAEPHLVPITFAVVGADTIVTAIDHKPKRTTALSRLDNIAANAAVSVLADHYEDDWSALWWARADGRAEVIDLPAFPSLQEALIKRYPDYHLHTPGGAGILIHVRRWSGWSAAD